jgi:hypothetical protein
VAPWPSSSCPQRVPGTQPQAQFPHQSLLRGEKGAKWVVDYKTSKYEGGRIEELAEKLNATRRSSTGIRKQ